MRVVFFGTSSFACPALEALTAHHDVCLVITQPDRPRGRHHNTCTPCATSSQAAKHGLPTVCPERINEPDAIKRLRAANADVFVVAAYGQLLHRSVFAIPSHGTINIHASLLPAYRGAAPVHWAIIHGETETGITTFFINEGMDTGEMLVQQSLTIDPDETAGALEKRLAVLGSRVILDTLAGIENGTVAPVAQPADGVSLAPRLTRDVCRLDWTQSAQDIHNRVRGTAPRPGAWTVLGDERIKIHESALTEIAVGVHAPGDIVLRETGRLLVACRDELVEIRAIQREGRGRVDGKAFLNGLRGSATFASS